MTVSEPQANRYFQVSHLEIMFRCSPSEQNEIVEPFAAQWSSCKMPCPRIQDYQLSHLNGNDLYTIRLGHFPWWSKWHKHVIVYWDENFAGALVTLHSIEIRKGFLYPAESHIVAVLVTGETSSRVPEIKYFVTEKGLLVGQPDDAEEVTTSLFSQSLV